MIYLNQFISEPPPPKRTRREIVLEAENERQRLRIRTLEDLLQQQQVQMPPTPPPDIIIQNEEVVVAVQDFELGEGASNAVLSNWMKPIKLQFAEDYEIIQPSN